MTVFSKLVVMGVVGSAGTQAHQQVRQAARGPRAAKDQGEPEKGFLDMESKVMAGSCGGFVSGIWPGRTAAHTCVLCIIRKSWECSVGNGVPCQP